MSLFKFSDKKVPVWDTSSLQVLTGTTVNQNLLKASKNWEKTFAVFVSSASFLGYAIESDERSSLLCSRYYNHRENKKAEEGKR